MKIEQKKLINICDFISGLWTGKKEPFQKIHVIRNTNFRPNAKLDLRDLAYLDVEQNLIPKKQIIKGDIILEKSGGGPKQPVGRVVLFDLEEKNNIYSFSNFTSVIRVKDKKVILPEFLVKYLDYFYISGQTKKMQKNSTGIRNLKMDEYKSIIIKFPSDINEQHKLTKKLDKIEKLLENLKDTNKKKIESYIKLNKSILRDSFIFE